MECFTGTREIIVRPDVINEIFKTKYLETSLEDRIFDKRLRFQVQNEYITLVDSVEGKQSALSKVKNDKLVLVENHKVISNITARNREQRYAIDALLDDSIKIVVLTGRAGSGKTLLTLAAALHEVDSSDTTYKRIILTRPMSWVGKHGLGILPGDVSEKFTPYLENYMCNLEYMMGGHKRSIQDTVAQYHMEFIPIQLIRGASWANSFIIADEVQVLNYEDMVALGTRVGEGSKIVIMGDLNQRDEKITKEKTGIYKLVNSDLAQKSPLVASVELQKCERSSVSELFANIFEV